MNRLVLLAVLLVTVLICLGCAEEAPEIPVPTKATILADAISLAETGNAEAQFALGNLYAEGKVVPNDFTEAAKWFRKAADQGHAQAQYTLGVIYSGGHGVPVDFAEGYVWYCLAEKSGVENASDDCDSLAGELQSEELVVANKRIDQLFEEIQLLE
jgi:TPR repeat protein